MTIDRPSIDYNTLQVLGFGLLWCELSVDCLVLVVFVSPEYCVDFVN